MTSSEKKLAAQNAREIAGARGGDTASPAILRWPAVHKRTGKSRTTAWRGIRAGTFPAPIQLGPNSIGWLETEIDEHMASLPRVRYAGAPDLPEGT